MGKLFEELKRRKVFKVGAAYAIVAWILIQVSGEVLPTFNTPEWVQQTITFLFFLGFPITLVMAWAYEVTPAGIKADDGTSIPVVTSNSTDRKLIYAVLGMVTLLGGIQISERLGSTDGQLNSEESDGAQNAMTLSNSSLSRRFRIDLGETIPRGGPGTRAIIDLTKDGSRLIYAVIRPNGDPLTYLLELDQPEERVFPGVTSTGNVFFSQDGEWVIFSNNGMHKVSVRGGSPQFLTDSMQDSAGGYWGSDGMLFYISDFDEGRHLMRLPANGGVPDLIETDGVSGVDVYYQPHLLPDGDTLLYTFAPGDVSARNGQISLLIQSTGETRTLIQGAYNARYVPTGHLVFVRSGALWAVPFDLEQLETTGDEVPVIQGVETGGGRGSAVYAFSNEGLLIYLPGGDTSEDVGLMRTITWVDRQGNEEDLALTRDFRVPVVSPDGQRLAVVVNENENDDIWTYDLERDILSRLTFDTASEYYPLWSNDGSRIVFHSRRDGGGLWWRAADGTGQAEPLLTGVADSIPYAFTSDGLQLVYSAGGDLHILDIGADTPPRPLIQSEFIETRAAISPNGRWIAYESNLTGQFEIYVHPFPDVDSGRWQVSNQGGVWPKWHSNGQELFYRTLNQFENSLWSVRLEAENSFPALPPSIVLTDMDFRGTGNRGGFDVSSDGSKFLFVSNIPKIESSEAFAARTTQLIVVDNWFEELKQLAPPDPQ